MVNWLPVLVSTILVSQVMAGTIRIVSRNNNVNINRIFIGDKGADQKTESQTICLFENSNFTSATEQVQLFPIVLPHDVNRLVVKLTPGIYASADLFISTFADPADSQTAPDAFSPSQYVGQAQTIDILLPGSATYYIGYRLNDGTNMNHASLCYKTVKHSVPNCPTGLTTNYMNNFLSCKLDLSHAQKLVVKPNKFNQLKIKFDGGSLYAKRDQLATMKRNDIASEINEILVRFDENTKAIYLLHRYIGDTNASVEFTFDFKPVDPPFPFPVNAMAPYTVPVREECFFLKGKFSSDKVGSAMTIPIKLENPGVQKYFKIEFCEKVTALDEFNFLVVPGTVPVGAQEPVFDQPPFPTTNMVQGNKQTQLVADLFTAETHLQLILQNQSGDVSMKKASVCLTVFDSI